MIPMSKLTIFSVFVTLITSVFLSSVSWAVTPGAAFCGIVSPAYDHYVYNAAIGTTSIYGGVLSQAKTPAFAALSTIGRPTTLWRSNQNPSLTVDCRSNRFVPVFSWIADPIVRRIMGLSFDPETLCTIQYEGTIQRTVGVDPRTTITTTLSDASDVSALWEMMQNANSIENEQGFIKQVNASGANGGDVLIRCLLSKNTENSSACTIQIRQARRIEVSSVSATVPHYYLYSSCFGNYSTR